MRPGAERERDGRVLFKLRLRCVTVAVEFLESKGFDVRARDSGIKEWAEAGLPTEGGMASLEFLAPSTAESRLKLLHTSMTWSMR